MKNPRRIFRQMVDKALGDSAVMSNKGRIGQYLEKLTPEEREAIQDLKSEEIKKDIILL
jgi:hypothetical protein